MTAEPTGHVMWSPNPVGVAVDLQDAFEPDVVQPGDYAAAGTPHYWRDELVLSAPFPIRLPIRDITP